MKEWRRRFIQENFIVRDAYSILLIPLYDEDKELIVS